MVSDALGPYGFRGPNAPEPFQPDPASIFNSVAPDMAITWKRDGTITAPLFEWWFDDPFPIHENPNQL